MLFACYIDQELAITHAENLIFEANISAILTDPKLVSLPGWISIKKTHVYKFPCFYKIQDIESPGASCYKSHRLNLPIFLWIERCYCRNDNLGNVDDIEFRI